MLDDWLVPFREALQSEFGDGPRVCTLATVGADERPRARSVICRLMDQEMFLFASDARSRKNKEVRRGVELVFWLAKLRQQYRLHGMGDAVNGFAYRGPVWRSLSDATRAMFFWPPPGAPRVDDEALFPAAVAADVSPPETFELIVFGPYEVERLDLNVHPHDRRRWSRLDDWTEHRLNP